MKRLFLIALLLIPLSASAYNVDSYSRIQNDPFDTYSFQNVDAMVQAIRAEGHPIPTGHPRIFIRPERREAQRNQIAMHFTSWMQEMVDLADAKFGQNLGPGNYKYAPEAQDVILAEALTYQLGLIPGITYEHTALEYGQDAVVHLTSNAMLEEGTYREHTHYLALPLGYDWLYDLMTDSQRRTVADSLIAYAQHDDVRIRAYNNPEGARLLGVLAIAGDPHVDPGEVDRLRDLFYNGLVFGDTADVGGMGQPYNVTANQILTPEGPGAEDLGYAGWWNPFYPILLAWRDQTGEDYFKLPFFQNWVFHMTHLTGNEYEHQSGWGKVKKASSFADVNPYLEIGLLPSNREAASLSKHHLEQAFSYGFAERLFYMLLSDTSLQAASPVELDLPLTTHFVGDNNVLSRSSWSGIEATWVQFQSPTWIHRDGGALNDLTIWKNGGMLLSAHNTRHNYDGGNRTNTMVLYDHQGQPGMTFIPMGVMDRSQNYNLGLASDEGLKDLDKDLRGYSEGLRFYENRPGEYLYTFGDGDQPWTFPVGRASLSSLPPMTVGRRTILLSSIALIKGRVRRSMSTLPGIST